MARAALLVLLAACGGDTVTENDCLRVTVVTCNHQVSCELAPDFASCEDDMQELWECDYTKTKDEFKACHASEPSCIESMSEQCFNVMCSTLLGCGFETVTGGSGAELGGG